MEKFLFKDVKVWILLLFLILGLIGAIGVSSLAVYRLQGGQKLPALSTTALTIARIPQTAVGIAQGQIKRDQHQMDDRFPQEPGGFSTLSTPVSQPNYILISRYDGDIGFSVVELVDEGTLKVRHRWVFDDDAQMAFDSDNRFILTPDRSQSHTMRIVHPWLDADGSLYAHVHFGAMYRFNACGDVDWVNADFMYHHSLEKDADGNFWSVGTTSIETDAAGFDENFLDNRAIQLSPEGRVLYDRSVMQILLDEGLRNLINDYDTYVRDPIHLNDVQPVMEDGEVMRRGDLFLSVSHLNLAMLYRPATQGLVWRTQDYMMQHHDIDIVAPDTIQIFDNRKKTGAGNRSMTVSANEMLRYTLPGQKAVPFMVEPMRQMDLRTKNQGLADAIPGSGIMMEDTNAGRLVKFSETGAPEWTYLNRSEDGRVWTLNWSRYLPGVVGDRALEALRRTSCND